MSGPAPRQVAEFIAVVAWQVSRSAIEMKWARTSIPTLDEMSLLYVARRTLTSMAERPKKSPDRTVDPENASALMDRMFNAGMDGDKLKENAEIVLGREDRPSMEYAAHSLLEYAIAADEEAGRKKHWK